MSQNLSEMKDVDIVCITISSPILIGVYKDKKLINILKSNEKSSEILPKIFKDILSMYYVKNIFYTNGPGSFMAIKIAYIFLKSISIIKNIPFFAIDAFYFNNNQPIKAIGKLFFVKIASEIKTQKLDTVPQSDFKLPNVLNYNKFTNITVPNYGIGSV